MLFAKPQLRVQPINPYQALAVVNDVALRLESTPELTRFAVAMGTRATCFHLGWTPEEMLRLDDEVRLVRANLR